MLSVNDAPTVVAPPANVTDNEDATPRVVSLTGVFTDVEDTSLTISASSSNGSLVSTSLSGSNLTLTYAPNASGSSVITLIATDSSGASVVTSFTAIVNSVNDAPVVSGPVNLGSMVEDSAPITITSGQLLANASDIDSVSLSVTGLTASVGTISGTGPWTYTPPLNFNGTVTFNYSVTDNAAPTAGITAASATLVVTAAPDLDTIDVNGPLNADSLNVSSNLLLAPNLSGQQFVVATDPSDAPGVEIGLRADMRFQPPAPRDPADPTKFYTSAGTALGTINDNGVLNDNSGPNVDDDFWARWNYTISINADTDNNGGTIGDLQYRFVLKNVTTNTVLANVTFEQALTQAGQAGLIPLINGSSLYQDSINFEPSFGTLFDPNAPGEYSVEVIAESRSNGTPLLANKIGIIINHAPVANADTVAATEDSAITFSAAQLLGNDTDANGNALTIKEVTSGANGTVVLNPDGSVTFTPDADFNGVADFTYKATDGKPIDSDSLAVTVTVNVLAVNDTPVLTVPTTVINGNEGTAITFTATAVDVEVPAEGQAFTYSLSGAPAGASINASTGAFTWTPSEGQGPSTYIFDVVVSDGVGGSDRKSVTINVAEVNSDPVLGTVGNKTVDEGTLLTFSATATDSDVPVQALTYSLANGTSGAVPAGASINPVSGLFTWTPSESQGAGTYKFDVVVSDGVTSDSETITITVNEVNVAPVLGSIGSRTLVEGSALSFTASATDADLPAQTLTFSLVGAPSGASIDGLTGAFSWTPTEAQGPASYTFTVQVSDGSLVDEEIITVTVTESNAAPVLAPIGDQTIAEGSLLTFTASASDADLPGQTLTFSLINAPVGSAINPTTGVFTWTPTEAQGAGSYSVTVVVSDGNGGSDSETITITVDEVNVAPVLTAIGDRTVSEGSPLTFTASATDTDLPANTLVFSLANGTAGSVPAGASINPATGLFTWTPSEAQGPGTFTFDVVVSDGTTTDSETITVTVTESNVAPVLTVPSAPVTGNELSPISFTATATDADLPTQTLTFSLSGAPAGASINASTGEFTWTPSEVQGPSTYIFDVVVSDGVGGSDRKAVTITVAEVNNAPVLGAVGNKTVDEGTLLTFSATATDSDVPVQALTYSLANGTGTVPAGASINPVSGLFTWTPSESQGAGTYTFDVVVSDGVTSDSETITITVNEVNVAPVLGSIGSRSVTEGSALTFTASATDADQPTQTLTYSLVGAPSGATIDGSSGAFSWTPNESQGPASYTFTVHVSDGVGGSDEEIITVTVVESNVTPELTVPASPVAASEGTTVTFTATTVDTDVPAQTLTYSLSGTVPAGASIDPFTGVFTWTPDETAGGNSFTISVVVSDGISNDTESVTIEVDETNVAPALAPIGNKAATEGQLLTFTATATDIDVPVQSLSFSLSSTAPAGAAITSGGIFTWTPSETQGGQSFTFDVKVTDGVTTTSETITITVAETNVAPVLTVPSTTVTGNELSPIAFTATVSDADQPTQVLTFSLSGAPAGATIDGSTGEFTWTPTEVQGPSTYIFDVVVTDSAGASDRKPVTITVAEVNSAPVLAAISSQTVSEGALLTFSATATDSDVPVQVLTYSLANGTGLVPAGASINPASGLFTWTPTESQGPATYTFDVVVSDGVTTASRTVTVVVNEVNVAPVLGSIGSRSVTEGSALTFTASATDADQPTQTLTYSLVGAPSGATINGSSGAFSWTPNESQGPASYTFTVRVSDGSLVDEEIITVTVTESNVAPVLTVPASPVAASEGTTVTFTATTVDTDVPAQTLTYSLSGTVPAGASIDPFTGVFNWTPDETAGGNSFTISVVVSDGISNDTESVTIEVAETNVAPALAPIGNKAATEGQLLTFTATATDIDVPVQSLSFSLGVTAPAGAAITSGGIFTWTPSETQGGQSFTFDVTVTDGVTTTTETITITVAESNVAPVLTVPSAPVTGNELSPIAFTATVSDADQPTQVLTFSLSGAPAGATIDGSTGEFTWTPTEVQGPSTYIFDVVVTDSAGASDRKPVTITVAEVNSAPVLAAISSQTVSEGALLTFNATATDSDVPVQVLTYSLANGTGLVPAGASINPASGLFTWTPTESQGPATYTFDVVVSDGVTTASRTVTVVVNEVNVAPVLGSIGSRTVSDGGTVSFTAQATDADVPVQTLTYSLVGAPSTATINPTSGAFSWTPAETDSPGNYTFTVLVSDGSLTDTEVITITVLESNVAPVLTVPSTTFAASEGSLLTFTASATDADGPGQTLTFSLSGTVPSGAAIDPLTGVFTWTPGESAGGNSLTFNVVVSDGSAVDTEAITINVTEVNNPPVANNDSYSTNEDVTLTVAAPGLLGNDTDVDTPTLTVNTVPVVAPLNGTLTLNANGSFTYVPNSNYYGPDSFQYSISDGTSTRTATVTLSIAAVNDNPVAGNDAFTGNEDTVINGNVASNDSDVDSSPLTYVALTQPARGTLAMNADGTFAFTPTANYFGPDTFSYRVIDGNGGSAIAVVNLTINSVNDVPVGNNQSVTLAEDGSLAITLTGSDIETAPGSLTYAVVGSPTNGTLTGSAPNLTYTPAANYFGSDSFTFTVTDANSGVSALATVSISVTAVNDAPVANAQTVNVAEDTAQSITLTGSDTEGSTISYIVVSGPANGTLTGTAPSLTYTPRANFNGSDSFTFKVNDGLLDSPVVTVTINVATDANAPDAVDDTIGLAMNSQATFNPMANDTEGVRIVSITENSVTTMLTYPMTIEMQHGTLFVISETVFSFSVDSGYTGTQTFSYSLSSGAQSDSATVTINVAAGNAAPVAVDETYSMFENGTLTTTDATGTGTLSTADNGVLANDTDSDLDALTAVILTGPANGTVTLLADGLFTYQPNVGFSGTDTFAYRVLDNNGGVDTGLVTIVVDPINHAPAGTDASVTLTRDPDAAATATALTVGNFGYSDVDGNTLLAVKITTLPAVGSLTLNSVPVTVGQVVPAADIVAGLLTYAPPTNAFGVVANFDFQVQDNGGTANGGVNLDPTANKLTIQVNSSDTAGPTITGVFVSSTAWSANFRDLVDSSSLPGGTGVGAGVLDGNARGYRVSNGANQLAILPWINVNQIVIQFSEDVGQSLSTSDFVITGAAGVRADGATGTIPRVNSYSYDALTKLATLTLNQSLDPSSLTLQIAFENISDVSGNKLDGEWDNSVDTVSGDGTAGGDFSFTFYALPGDINQNGVVDANDSAVIPATRNYTNALYNYLGDVTGNNIVNGDDRDNVQRRWTSRRLP